VILENAKTIRTHLKAFSPPFAIINVNANKYFLETLDGTPLFLCLRLLTHVLCRLMSIEIHDRILAAIQNAYKNEYFLKPLKSSGGLTSNSLSLLLSTFSLYSPSRLSFVS
jgi:hypothetical protein